jgi:hypothetical protein
LNLFDRVLLLKLSKLLIFFFFCYLFLFWLNIRNCLIFNVFNFLCFYYLFFIIVCSFLNFFMNLFLIYFLNLMRFLVFILIFILLNRVFSILYFIDYYLRSGNLRILASFLFNLCIQLLVYIFVLVRFSWICLKLLIMSLYFI